MTALKIQTYCHILNSHVMLNGNLYYENQNVNDSLNFLKETFKFSGISYPKFYKMDDLSKLGFLAAEILLKNTFQENYSYDEVGIVLSNAQSTLITDSNFQESINDYRNFYPSPSIFVYTLPNIMIGEISIRHKLRGENAFFIFEKFNAAFISEYIHQLFSAKKIKACIGGWVDLSTDGYEAFLYYVSQSENGLNIEHKAEQIEKLYKLNK